MLSARRAILLLLLGSLARLVAQSSPGLSPFGGLAVGVGATSLWWRSGGAAESHEGQLEDNRPSVTGGLVAGALLGRSLRIAASGDAIWLAAEDQDPELALQAGVHLEYIFPPGSYYLFGQAGVCWHIVSPWSSTREIGRGPGFAIGAGYRLTRLLSVEARCSFSGFDEAAHDNLGYRHISMLAALRATVE
jgi:hypothetical protein